MPLQATEMTAFCASGSWAHVKDARGRQMALFRRSMGWTLPAPLLILKACEGFHRHSAWLKRLKVNDLLTQHPKLRTAGKPEPFSARNHPMPLNVLAR